MEHTPGPWTMSESKRHPIIYIFGDGKQIASTYGEGDYYFTQKPNADLIVAAPNMKLALEKIEQMAQHRVKSQFDAVQLLLDIRALAGKTLAEI